VLRPASRFRIGQIGAGKFGTMFLSQVRLTPACTWQAWPT